MLKWSLIKGKQAEILKYQTGIVPQLLHKTQPLRQQVQVLFES